MCKGPRLHVELSDLFWEQGLWIFCSQLCISGMFLEDQSGQWAVHQTRAAQGLKNNLKTDGIKLQLLALQSCIIQSYSQYFLPFHRHQILKSIGKCLMKKSHHWCCTWTSSEIYIVQYHPGEAERKYWYIFLGQNFLRTTYQVVQVVNIKADLLEDLTYDTGMPNSMYLIQYWKYCMRKI